MLVPRNSKRTYKQILELGDLYTDLERLREESELVVRGRRRQEAQDDLVRDGRILGRAVRNLRCRFEICGSMGNGVFWNGYLSAYPFWQNSYMFL